MVMENYRKIIENINSYYPKNCSYEYKEYRNTEEYDEFMEQIGENNK